MTSEKTQMLMADLARRGKKGLEFAKQTMRKEKMDYQELHEALEYYLSNWCDFTHAGLFSLSCEAVGGDPDDSVQIQASIAMIAAAFDLHDDILDRSRTKNSSPTVYGKHGEELTLLLGNAFLIEGFALLIKSISEVSPSKLQGALQALKLNLFDVGNAHASELGFKGKTAKNPEEYLSFVKKKAASIEADMTLGAIIGGGTEDEIKALGQYGRTLGILTTLREEFIDVFELEELKQKVKIDRLPIPMVFAMQNAKAKEEIDEILIKKKIAKKDIGKIVEIVFESRSVKKLKKNMEDFADIATTLLLRLPNRKAIGQLNMWVSSMLEDL